MIVIRIQGGLGNQLFQVTFGRSLARTEKEVIIHDLFHLDKALTVRENQLAKIGLSPLRFRSRISLSLLSVFSRVLRGRRMAHLEERRFGFDPQMKRGEDADIYVSGYFQSLRYAEPQLEWVRQTIQGEAFLRRVPESIRLAVRRSDSLVVHIRRGDYLSAPGQLNLHGVCSPQYYRNAYARLSRNQNFNRVFLFTDDKNYAREVSSWFPVPSEVMAFSGPDSDLIEFFLMRLGANFIIANSTFSYWAALLSEQKDAQVVAPIRWFANEQISPQDLFPPHWMLE